MISLKIDMVSFTFVNYCMVYTIHHVVDCGMFRSAKGCIGTAATDYRSMFGYKFCIGYSALERNATWGVVF